MDVIDSGQRGHIALHALYPPSADYPQGLHVITHGDLWSSAIATRDIVLAAGLCAWIEDEEQE